MNFERFSEPPELELWEVGHRITFLTWIFLGCCLAPLTIAPYFFIQSTAWDLSDIVLAFILTEAITPYAVLAVFVKVIPFGIIAVIALIQFPLYGLFIGMAQRRGVKSRNAVIGWLCISHMAAVGVAFFIDDIRFGLP